MAEADAGASHSASVRFLAFCGELSSLRQRLLSLVPSPERPERLNRILNCFDLVVYASPETPFLRLAGDKGLVLGHPLGQGSRQKSSDRQSLARALTSTLRDDMANFELPPGGYVAIVRASRSIAVLRGPPGVVAAHYFDLMSVTALFSHIELCRQLTPEVPDIHTLEAGISLVQRGQTARPSTVMRVQN